MTTAAQGIAIAIEKNKQLSAVNNQSLPLDVDEGGTGATTAANARAALDLEVGVDVEAYSAVLDAAAALPAAGTANKSVVIKSDGTTVVARGGGKSCTIAANAYTLAAGDVLYKVLEMSNGTNITFTIPTGINLQHPMAVVQVGAGTITPTAGAGVTMVMPSGKTKSNGAGTVFTIYPSATAEKYYIDGNLAA